MSCRDRAKIMTVVSNLALNDSQLLEFGHKY